MTLLLAACGGSDSETIDVEELTTNPPSNSSDGTTPPLDLPPSSTPSVTNTNEVVLASLKNIKANQIVEIPAGNYTWQNLVEIDGKKLASGEAGVHNITIRGAGQGQTVIDLSGLPYVALSANRNDVNTPAAWGFLLKNLNGVTLENMTFKNSPRHAVRIETSQNVKVKNVQVQWSADKIAKEKAHGLYLIYNQSVELVGNQVDGAIDAGIYIGRSKKVLFKDNELKNNLLGTAFEDVANSSVLNNRFHDNAVGFLINENEDNDTQSSGYESPDGYFKGQGSVTAGQILVSGNIFENNNRRNFAPDKSQGAGPLPAGTGLIVFNADRVEVSNNELINNQFANLYIGSTLAGVKLLGLENTMKDPYPEYLTVTNNRFTNHKQLYSDGDLQLFMNILFRLAGQAHITDILEDGLYHNENKGDYHCFKDNIAVLSGEEASYGNVWLSKTNLIVQALAQKPGMPAQLGYQSYHRCTNQPITP